MEREEFFTKGPSNSQGRLSVDSSSYMPNHIQVQRTGVGLCSQEPGRSSVLYKYRGQRKVFSNRKQGWRDFPGGPSVKTLHFQCRDLGFDPWLGNGDPTCWTTRPKENKKIGMEENSDRQKQWMPLITA